MAQRRVVCAAIRAADGDLLLGIRHYSADMHRQIEARTDGAKFHHCLGDDQGFVDQHGVYMTRAEASRVASEANQIVYRSGSRWNPSSGRWELFSEGLY